MTANTTVVLPLARPGQTVARMPAITQSGSITDSNIGCRQAEKEYGECHQNHDHDAHKVEPAVTGYQVDHG